ncbi:hypothetical protein M0657_012302 [Pyricularia oryzae]|uniref:Uncharacterized protein n=1 Tax=Pyricularia oryzae (strain Y34) TaxID=1143189 RepID=A0AA97NMH7_PYRO3|nr:hypothetical protein OOU_Y34scaffold01022g1 [Pyricularia oryzae Y34]KAI7908412.1 hypothetical protein M0657_012302 [Pyricularia oryzae]KAI7908491.1 hypothetical protein M9X92_012158 [Pyricularia oryzae]
MRSILYLVTGALGMVTFAHALPALFFTSTNTLDITGRSVGPFEPGRNSVNGETNYQNHQILQKRVKPHKVSITNNAGASGSRGGGLPSDTVDTWIEAAQIALASISCNQGTITNGPHSGEDSSSSDPKEHITVQPHNGGPKMHVYIDGTYTRAKTTHKKGKKGK